MQDGAERIIKRVLDEAQHKAEEIKTEAKEKAAVLIREAEEEALRRHEQIAGKARKESAEIKRRIIGVAELESRKALLAAKQEMIAQSFSKALDELSQIDDIEYRKIMKNLLLKEVESGTEAVACSPRDKERLTSDFWDDVNRSLQASGKKGELSLSPESRDILGGFILLSEGVELNCSFEALLETKRDELEPEIAALLFK